MPRINTYSDNASIENDDKVLTYDTQAAATKITAFSTIWNWIVSKLHALSSSSAALTPSTDRVLMDKNGAMTRVEPAAVAKYGIETYNGSTIAGSAQTVKAALDALNSKITAVRIPDGANLNSLVDDGIFQVGNIKNYANYPDVEICGTSGLFYVKTAPNYREQIFNGNLRTAYRQSFDGGSTWQAWIYDGLYSEIQTLNSKMPWTRLAEVLQGANASTDETITVSDMTGAREVLFTIQRVSNGRTFASAVVPYAQFNGGAVYAFGSYVMFADLLKNTTAIGVNAVCIWKSATQVEIAADANDEAIKIRFWMR